MSSHGFWLESRYGSRHRRVWIEPGLCYLVVPLNKQKLKHRDRTGVLLEPLDPDDPMPSSFNFRFYDNNRCGKVDPSDLVDFGPRTFRATPAETGA